ncbi:hypothetical protein [Burkholderia seminalis]|uniref:Uncharacterized protein n=1 Tax=Burkholderia seminalis TaxID=488731 RepID=A0A8A8D6U1_9BURK|nr:hypothetical protein [Burkholderia seminalis]QTO20320.1 hypothetical protein DT99_002625 [Burkholderia seminalis]
MNRVSQFVNNFLHYVVATAGLNFRTAEAVPAKPQPHCFPSAPRFRERERGVILCTSRRPRKPFVKKV